MHTEDQRIGLGDKKTMSDIGTDEILDLSDIAFSGDDEIIELSDIVLDDSDGDSIIELSDIAEKDPDEDGGITVSVDDVPEEDDDLIEFGEFARALGEKEEDGRSDVSDVDFKDEDFSIDLDLDMDDTGDGFFADTGTILDIDEDGAGADEDPDESTEVSQDPHVTVAAQDERVFTDEQLETAIERVISKMFSEKIDRLLNVAIEKVVTGEIERIKKDLLDQNNMDLE